ncbi:MAG: hypothetical protein LBE37_08925 [Sphingobacterium sp.]|jgi:hypothetical protein|nr:hypothetical protein [Sphingobacterium sp.]
MITICRTTIILIILFSVYSCYKLTDVTPHYEDGYSQVIYDLAGDTLASDGWGEYYEKGDIYLRQRYFTSKHQDSIRFVPLGNELINAAKGVNTSTDNSINWLMEAREHPSSAKENDAYYNNNDNKRLI